MRARLNREGSINDTVMIFDISDRAGACGAAARGCGGLLPCCAHDQPRDLRSHRLMAALVCVRRRAIPGTALPAPVRNARWSHARV